MVDWKLYIDSPQKRVLDLCGGSLDDGGGYGDGVFFGAVIAVGGGDGRSSNKW